MSVWLLTYSLHDATLMTAGLPLPWGCKTKRKNWITSHSFSMVHLLFMPHSNSISETVSHQQISNGPDWRSNYAVVFHTWNCSYFLATLKTIKFDTNVQIWIKYETAWNQICSYDQHSCSQWVNYVATKGIVWQRTWCKIIINTPSLEFLLTRIFGTTKLTTQ